MIFSFDLRRARKGDCFLVHYGTPADPGLLVVDAGPADVYRPHLLPRLEAIRVARGLTPSEPLAIDTLMVSHVDDDHINGVLELTKSLVERQRNKKPLPFKIRGLWHNAFEDLLGKGAEQLVSAVTTRFGPASLTEDTGFDGLDPATAKVLASIGQGVSLRRDASMLKLKVNPQFAGRPVCAAAGSQPIDMARELSLLVAGPMQPELDKLRKEYDAFLRRAARAGATAPPVLASFTDTSIANLSSIVVLASAGGKRMLLTGDARGDKILAGLRLAGAMTQDRPLHVDLLKMPHHGSDRNMTRAFLEQVTADHYVFSGDGEHGNPERETLDMLRLARGDADYAIHFTYPIDAIDAGRKADWEEQQRMERARNKKTIRPNWSAKKHALSAFFTAHPTMARKVETLPPSGTHVIDLLDPLGW